MAEHELASGRVVEIGCEDGHLLDLVCARTGAPGLGFELGRNTLGAGRRSGGAGILAEPFRGDLGEPAGLLTIRHVLERLADPLDALRLIASALHVTSREGASLHVEVPNGLPAIRRI